LTIGLQGSRDESRDKPKLQVEPGRWSPPVNAKQDTPETPSPVLGRSLGSFRCSDWPTTDHRRSCL